MSIIIISRSSLNWVMFGQKLGRLVKSKKKPCVQSIVHSLVSNVIHSKGHSYDPKFRKRQNVNPHNI